MSDPCLPFDIKKAMIAVCGRAFYYKHLLFDIFARAGIPKAMFRKYQEQPKFVITRQLLDDLERMGDNGLLLQRRLLTELCKLKTLPDDAVLDRDAGLDALRELKHLAVEHDLSVEDDRVRGQRATASARAAIQRAGEVERRLKELNQLFAQMCSATDYQARGYDLEDLVTELFALYQIPYRKPYRTQTEQVDGHFHFGGFDYLVETRWRKEQTTLDELLAFKGKVDRKIESTRGLFISVSGFRPDADEYLRQAGSANLILMDGYDLTMILDGRVTLTDALRVKAEKASQEGRLFFPLTESLRPGVRMNASAQTDAEGA